MVQCEVVLRGRTIEQSGSGVSRLGNSTMTSIFFDFARELLSFSQGESPHLLMQTVAWLRGRAEKFSNVGLPLNSTDSTGSTGSGT